MFEGGLCDSGDHSASKAGGKYNKYYTWQLSHAISPLTSRDTTQRDVMRGTVGRPVPHQMRPTACGDGGTAGEAKNHKQKTV
jgi:hypothetical protein